MYNTKLSLTSISRLLDVLLHEQGS